MSYVMIDCESDGPIPGKYSMIAFAAIIINQDHTFNSFSGRLKPISENWLPECLKVSGYSRAETLNFDDPKKVMQEFSNWLSANCIGNPIFISDNNGYDWQFINWYFWYFLNMNPFGHSSYNLGSLYKGIVKNTCKNFKHLRKTKHTHNPLDDAKGNAEALLEIIKLHDLKIGL